MVKWVVCNYIYQVFESERKNTHHSRLYAGNTWKYQRPFATQTQSERLPWRRQVWRGRRYLYRAQESVWSHQNNAQSKQSVLITIAIKFIIWNELTQRCCNHDRISADIGRCTLSRDVLLLQELWRSPDPFVITESNFYFSRLEPELRGTGQFQRMARIKDTAARTFPHLPQLPTFKQRLLNRQVCRFIVTTRTRHPSQIIHVC